MKFKIFKLLGVAALFAVSLTAQAQAQFVLFGYVIAEEGTPEFQSIPKYFDLIGKARQIKTERVSGCPQTVQTYLREQTLQYSNFVKIEVRDVGPGISRYSRCSPESPYVFFRIDVPSAGEPMIALPSDASTAIYRILGKGTQSSFTIETLQGNSRLYCRDSRYCLVFQK